MAYKKISTIKKPGGRSGEKVSPPKYMKMKYDAMRRLVNKYGLENAKEALQQCEWAVEKEEQEEKETPKGGRPLEYRTQQLMQVWLYVEEAMFHTKRSALAACSDKKARFDWIGLNTRGAREIKSITGKTLLRRYQGAKAFLKAQSAPYQKHAASGFTIKIEGNPVS